jgi:hypothetical protein
MMPRLKLKDNTGTTHEGCGGVFKETTIFDDWDGYLHCSKCDTAIKRYSVGER